MTAQAHAAFSATFCRLLIQHTTCCNMQYLKVLSLLNPLLGVEDDVGDCSPAPGVDEDDELDAEVGLTLEVVELTVVDTVEEVELVIVFVDFVVDVRVVVEVGCAVVDVDVVLTKEPVCK